MTQTLELDKEITVYEQMKSELLKNHMGKFVIIHDGKLAGVYDNFNNAADAALRQFGRGPYLIRLVSDDITPTMPASVAYRIKHASN
jgi:hypothetical protein